jgi:hypothetical protein
VDANAPLDRSGILELVKQEGGVDRLERLVRQLQAVGVRRSNGSPEGVVTAPVGALYTRTDGGAGTTLYVKESGTGDTGWVAK